MFTQQETAAYLGISPSAVHDWSSKHANGRSAKPLITKIPSRGRSASIPFIGFAEAYVLSAFRKAGVPMQRIRPAVSRLSKEIGIDHALASRKLFTDGVEVIFDFASEDAEHSRLTVVRTGQQQFKEIVRDYLRCITYGDDGLATSLKLSLFHHTDVVVDPRRGFGMPVLAHHSVRIEDLVDRFRAGDGILEIAEDFRVDPREIEDVLRVALAA